MKQKITTKQITILGLLGAVAFLMMSTFSVPLIPGAQFLRFEPSEIPVLVASVTFGPVAGVMTNLIKDILYFMFRAKGIFGPLSDFLITSVFAFVVGWVYQKKPGSKGLILACIVGIIARTIAMIPVNCVILPLQFGYGADKVLQMMPYALLPFNLIKAVINSFGTVVLYQLLLKRVPKLLHSGNMV
jgi:ECF transporter S component (folate family)